MGDTSQEGNDCPPEWEEVTDPASSEPTAAAGSNSKDMLFSELEYPPPRSSTGRMWYVFKPEHKIGPCIAGGWDAAKRHWVHHRAPRGFANLDEAVADCINEWFGKPAEAIKLLLN